MTRTRSGLVLFLLPSNALSSPFMFLNEAILEDAALVWFGKLHNTVAHGPHLAQLNGMLRRWPVGFRERMEPRLRSALDEVETIFAELPREWLHVDGDESLPVQLDQERVDSALRLPFTDPDRFWALP